MTSQGSSVGVETWHFETGERDPGFRAVCFAIIVVHMSGEKIKTLQISSSQQISAKIHHTALFPGRERSKAWGAGGLQPRGLNAKAAVCSNAWNLQRLSTCQERP